MSRSNPLYHEHPLFRAARAERLLRHLAREAGGSSWIVFHPERVARELGLLASEVLRLTSHLEAHGYLERPPFGSLLHVTPAGYAYAHELAPPERRAAEGA